METRVAEWLLGGEPAVRWQVMRDLLDCTEQEWQAERRRVAMAGTAKQLIELQDPEGTWGGGIYGPKWTSTTYTLLTLIDFGIDPSNDACQSGAASVFERGIGA